MLARLMAFSVWLLLGGSVAYWGLQLFSRPLAMPASVQAAGESRTTQVDLSRLLGVTAPEVVAQPEVAPSTRLRLLGVVAPKNPKAADAGEGVALIEVDGVPRTVRVGAVVDGELRLLRVDARSASLGGAAGVVAQVLEISPPATPATGSLPTAAPSPVVLGGNPPGTLAQQPVAVGQPSGSLPLAASAAVPTQGVPQQPAQRVGVPARVPPAVVRPLGGSNQNLPPTPPPYKQNEAAER